MLEFIYNSYNFISSVFIRELAEINQYDPYQVDQLKTQFNFNPYHIGVEMPACTTDEECDGKDMAMVNEEACEERFVEEDMVIINDKDCDEDMVMINEEDCDADMVMINEEDCDENMVVIDKEILNYGQVQEGAECYFNRFRLLATHAFIYGIFTAYEFLWAERPVSAQAPIDPEKKMRGFGVDFGPSTDRPAALQFRIKRDEKESRKVFQNSNCLQAQKTSLGFPYKSWDDHEWGLVERDYSVYYKVF